MKKLIVCLSLVLMIIGFENSCFLNAAGSVSNIKAAKVTLTSGKLNVRSEADKTSKIISTLNNGDYVTLISKSGDWWYIEYSENKYGYCHENYLKEVYGVNKQVNIQSGTLNVRKGDGTQYAVKGNLNKNEEVIELWTKGDWSYILYGGSEKGFVSTKYLKNSTVNSVNYPQINLNVPDFKQTDSRWAKVKLGNSGKTIGDIGCTTTGIAMLESYRNGYNIYPNEMAKKLSYTQSGNLYWPADYKAVTNSKDYLNKIYNLLKEGKPVLFGGKNAYGSQHWVVITGFKGGENLTESGFLINDPGTAKRVTLKDFLNSYPNFYKFIYY